MNRVCTNIQKHKFYTPSRCSYLFLLVWIMFDAYSNANFNMFWSNKLSVSMALNTPIFTWVIVYSLLYDFMRLTINQKSCSSWKAAISDNVLLKAGPTCWENQASRVVAKTTPKNCERRSFCPSLLIYIITRLAKSKNTGKYLIIPYF